MTDRKSNERADGSRVRQIGLTDEVVNALFLQGVAKGFKSFATYAAHLLIEQSKVK